MRKTITPVDDVNALGIVTAELPHPAASQEQGPLLIHPLVTAALRQGPGLLTNMSFKMMEIFALWGAIRMKYQLYIQ